MPDKMPPFIGITDFTCREETEAMLKVLRSASGDNIVRKLGVGVMMSRRTLNGIPSRFDGIFPAKEKVRHIFINDPLAYNVLHYADYEGIGVLRNLQEVVKWSGPNLEGIQLDMVWPDPDTIKQFKQDHHNIQLILQINPFALERVENNKNKLVERLKYYQPNLDGVLIDMSMGQGVPMDWLQSLSHIEAIKSELPDLSFILAGGLGPNSLHLVQPLIDTCDLEFSTDAEGQLRPSGSMMQPIDWEMAKEYLSKAVIMFEDKYNQRRRSIQC